jgi:hypothetical protein
MTMSPHPAFALAALGVLIITLTSPTWLIMVTGWPTFIIVITTWAYYHHNQSRR